MRSLGLRDLYIFGALPSLTSCMSRRIALYGSVLMSDDNLLPSIHMTDGVLSKVCDRSLTVVDEGEDIFYLFIQGIRIISRAPSSQRGKPWAEGVFMLTVVA